MILALRSLSAGLAGFVRTPTLGRSIAGLLAAAIVLLLATNFATFLMIQRTSRFNETVERAELVRRDVRSIQTEMINAETGQRGFLLAARPEYLRVYAEAVNTLPELITELTELTRDDPDLAPRVGYLKELTDHKLTELDRTIQLSRMGRIGEAMSIVRTDEGKAVMGRIRSETAAVDEIMGTRLQFLRRQSEWAAGATVAANAMAGLLILTLAGIIAWLVRRYFMEGEAAREALDRANATLEAKVRERTADLSRANEEIQRFAYIVSHDLRAPLVNIMGYTSELEQAGRVFDHQMKRIETNAPKSVEAEALVAVREDVPEAIGFIRASTAKMDRLINAILKLSREGRRGLAPELLDMNRMVQAIADSVRHQTDQADAEIIIETLPLLESDRLSIEQIFGNLIDNAIKYLEPERPGRVVVSGGAEPGGWLVYRVSDNGRGVSERDHERIFELFRRSGRQDRSGEGLGLAFVRNSVRRLGGHIEVESELGKGSTFILKFPTRLILEEAGDAA
jgi:signal transduction histidine kinase